MFGFNKGSLKQRKRIEALNGYLFLLPLFLLMGIFIFYSIFYVFRISLFRWDGVNPDFMKYIGLKNFKFLFTDPLFFTAIKNVLIFMVLTVSIQLIIGLIVALLLRPKLRGHSFYKALFYIPAALSVTVIARLFDGIYEPNFGLLNSFLRTIGLDSWASTWLGDPHLALYAIIIANIFQWMGAQMVFYIAGLTAIPDEYFEAAQIDGAGFWETLYHIVLPLLTPIHTTVIVLGIIGSVKTFDLVWLLTQGGPGTATHTLATLFYKTAVREFQAGYGAAVAVVMVVLALGLSLLQLRIYNQSDVGGNR